MTMTQSINSTMNEPSLIPSQEEQLLINPIKDETAPLVQLIDSKALNTVPQSSNVNSTPQLFVPSQPSNSQQFSTPTKGANPQQYNINASPAIPSYFIPNSKAQRVSESQPNASIIDLSDEKWNANGVPQDSLNAIFNSVVYDEVGNRHEMHSLWSDFKTIFIFVRSLLCFTTKEYVEDLSLIPRNTLTNAQVRLVVITPSHWKHLRAFRKLTRYQYLLFSDMDQSIYNKLGFKKTNDLGMNGDSPHVKSGNFGGIFSTMRRALNSTDNQGPRDQQGGSLIVGPGPYLHFSHVDKNARDHYTINGLLNKVNIQAINFPHQYQESKYY